MGKIEEWRRMDLSRIREQKVRLYRKDRWWYDNTIRRPS